MIEIKNRWTGAVLFSVEAETLAKAVVAAIKNGAINIPKNILSPYRDDIRKVLDAAPSEVGGLLEALWHGKVDGARHHVRR